MAISRADFQIAIKTSADTAGIDQTKEKIGQTTEATHDLGKENLNTGDASEEAGDKGEKAGEKLKEAAEHATLSHRELKEVIREVARTAGEQIPGIGLLFNPVTAAILATLTVVEQLKNGLEDLQAPAEALQKSLLALDLSKIQAVAAAARDAATAWADIASSEAKAAAEYERGATALDNQIKKQKEQIQAIIAVEEAKEKAFEAEIRRREKLSEITHEQAEDAIASARLNLDEERGQAEVGQFNVEIAARKKELAESLLRLRKEENEHAIHAAQTEEQKTAVELEKRKTAAASAGEEAIKVTGGAHQGFDIAGRVTGEATYKNEDELRKALAKVKETIEDVQLTGAVTGGKKMNADEQKNMLEGLEKEKTAMEQSLAAHEQYIRNLQTEVNVAEAANKAAKTKTEIATEQLQHDREALRSGPDRIKALEDERDIKDEQHRQVQEQNRRAAQTESQTRHIEAQNQTPQGQAATQRREAQSQDDIDIQQEFSSSQGASAAIQAANVRTHAREILATVRGEGGPAHATAEHLQETHEVLMEVLGLLKNHAHQINAQRGDLNEIRSELQNLFSRAGNTAGGYGI